MKSMAQLFNLEQSNLESVFVSYMDMMLFMYDSRPFLSAHGYAGLCLGRTQLGDIICILLGAHVPYIIREVSDCKYKLIGEAYVYGIMDGEFVNQESPQPEIFKLE
jgi:hypothetical protein